MATKIIAHTAHVHYCRVLLVEDNPLIQRLHNTLLKSLGCQVCLATTGLTAINVAAYNKFDLILMDIGLPDISGIEAARHIRKQGANKTTTIFALTSQNTEKTRRRALQAGMNGYLAKPTSFHDLKKLLQKLGATKQQRSNSKVMKIGRVLLKPKEGQTLYYLVRGMTAKEIGAQLYVSKRTIEHRLFIIKRKFGCRTRSKLISTALDLGFPVTELL